MTPYALPLLYTLFVWWFSTGVILFLNGLPRRTFKWTMLGTTLMLVGALVGQSVWAMRGLDPLFQVLRTVPPLAMSA